MGEALLPRFSRRRQLRHYGLVEGFEAAYRSSALAAFNRNSIP